MIFYRLGVYYDIVVWTSYQVMPMNINEKRLTYDIYKMKKIIDLYYEIRYLLITMEYFVFVKIQEQGVKIMVKFATYCT